MTISYSHTWYAEFIPWVLESPRYDGFHQNYFNSIRVMFSEQVRWQWPRAVLHECSLSLSKTSSSDALEQNSKISRKTWFT